MICQLSRKIEKSNLDNPLTSYTKIHNRWTNVNKTKQKPSKLIEENVGR